MKLRDLQARFVKYVPYPDTWTEMKNGASVEVSGMRDSWKDVDSLAEADGVAFLCPPCFLKNAGSVGTDTCICWFKNKVPDGLNPGPGRWNPQGTGIDDLTFVGPGQYSVGHPHGHFYVENGEANIR